MFKVHYVKKVTKKVTSYFLYASGLALFVMKRRVINGLSVVLYFHNPSPKQLQDCILGLKKAGLVPGRIEDLYAISERSQDVVKGRFWITLDDGWKGNMNLQDVLLANDTTAILFLQTEPVIERTAFRHISGVEAMQCNALSREEICQMLSSGAFELGLHTHTHPDLSVLTPEQIGKELDRNLEAMEELSLGYHRILAYPHGRDSFVVQQVLRRYGIKLAFSTQPGHIDASVNPLSIPRYSYMGEFRETMVRIAGFHRGRKR